ncbi:hypothetical protein BGZ49_002918, partial [Haplosporangium sp. Z 27]
MNSGVFRTVIKSAARASRIPINPALPAQRHALLSLRQSARTYASQPLQTLPHHSNSDAAWLIGSLVFFGPLIYKLTAPPPRKTAAQVDHHHAPSSSNNKGSDNDAAEITTTTAAPKYEKDFYPYILI